MNAGFKVFESIVLVNRNNFCCKHGTVVHAFVGDEMNHDACVFYLAALISFVGAFDGVCAGKVYWAGQDAG